MRITPLDIRHKEFSRSMRGYKDLEVDEFLDEITEEFERLFNENIDHKERLESLEDKISQYQNIEDTLQKTLISAQQQAEELKQNAQKEADLILRDAELKSRSIVNDSYAERQKIQRSVQALKQKHEDLRYQLRKIIESYANIIEQDVDSFDELAGLDDTEAAPVTADAALTGIDDAASEELLGGERADDQAKAGGGPIEADGSGAAAASMLLRGPFAGSETEKDPFDDLEIDANEDKFKW